MVRLYESSDFEQIDSWHFDRLGTHLQKHFLPKTGWVVPMAACGFLYLTNSSIAYIDMYITNPDISKELRHEAIQLITDAIIAYAKEIHVKLLICESKYQVIKEFAIKNDFKYDGIFSSFSRGI